MMNIEELLSQIDEQIAVNGGWNIFYQGEDSSLRIADDTIDLIKTTVQLNGPEVEFLINQLTEKALKEFYRVNQYYSFTEFHQLALRMIYYQLFYSIREMNGAFGKEK
ncbi:MAG TPA: hypothetical protein PKH79_16045, partial [Prolixibacteraceae bacterium]|nr:hypothetical protein [Prolixibacteraceae bacterium]